MKRFIIIGMALIGLMACKNNTKKMQKNHNDFSWQVDRFDDTKVLRYKVASFDSLSLQQKELIYYLSEAALCGRDIFFDQNFKYNLDIRKTLEAMYREYQGDRDGSEFLALEKYLKKVWFANGIHHHYSNDKFRPEFSERFFTDIALATPSLQDKGSIIESIIPIIFDDKLYPTRISQENGVDLILSSANNFYDGVTQAEAEKFYADMAAAATEKERPVSYGLNSRLVKEDGVIQERVWKISGEYSAAIEKIVYWLEKAAGVAENNNQRNSIEKLISFYRSGDLKEFDNYNISWVSDTTSMVDFVNGFIEVYGDPLGYKASWESNVNFKNIEATKRTELISTNAQWFEDNSPIDDKYKKASVKGVSAKVITVAMLGGDCFPSTPIGINLPNADWIRKEHGSKSVTIQNITYAYSQVSAGDGFAAEFYPSNEVRTTAKEYGSLAGDLHTDLHECLGHGSGQLGKGTKGDELKNYGSPLEEARADLFALYYMGDNKLVELGIMPSMKTMEAAYYNSIFNGMMGQLTRIEKGKNIVQAHMRCRQLIARWCYEKGADENVIEIKKVGDKNYIIINDYKKLRVLFGDLLKEIQRIKSEGDFTAGAALVEGYGVKIDPTLHEEVLTRYAVLNLAPYSGFVNPKMTPVTDANGKITDIRVTYDEKYVQQMMRYSDQYSFL